ncbi:MAG: uridine kinase [Nitrospirae bacterium]|nr:uridine kinase [Nitrospirota bacterium]
MNSDRFILGICGGSGSGKTYTVVAIKEKLPFGSVSLLDQDSYYRDLSHLTSEKRSSINFDHPGAIDFDLLIRDLERLSAGDVVKKPVYDFSAHRRASSLQPVNPAPIIIIEGHHIFCNEELRSKIDHKVFLNVEMDIRFIRRLGRDIKERGRDLDSVVQQYMNSVRPMDIEFVQSSMKYADTVICREDHELKLNEIVSILKSYLKNRRVENE